MNKEKISELGKFGEQRAREFIKITQEPLYLQQLDWLYKNQLGEWISVEVKNKELFSAGGGCNFDGQGLPILQVMSRIQLQMEKDIRCLFLVFDPSTDKIYQQWLDVLEKTIYYDIPPSEKNHWKGIRIYDINEFDDVTDLEKCMQEARKEESDQWFEDSL